MSTIVCFTYKFLKLISCPPPPPPPFFLNVILIKLFHTKGHTHCSSVIRKYVDFLLEAITIEYTHVGPIRKMARWPGRDGLVVSGIQIFGRGAQEVWFKISAISLWESVAQYLVTAWSKLLNSYTLPFCVVVRIGCVKETFRFRNMLM